MCAKGTNSFYIHVPFCNKRCDYCSFYSNGGEITESAFDDYLRLVLAQIKHQQNHFQLKNLRSLYIGGGTPSGVGCKRLSRLLTLLQKKNLTPTEYTVECNPEDVSLELLELLEKFGVNRLSVGIQSFDQSLLSSIGRRTSLEQNLSALKTISTRWNGQLSLDLMFALPGQTEEMLLNDLEKILQWKPHHLSLYELDMEKGTKLFKSRKSLSPVSKKQKQNLYRTAVKFLKAHGFHHYEVSNFCLPGFSSLHNSAYWRLLPYGGAGPGAVMMSGFNGNRAIRKTILPKRNEPIKSTYRRWKKTVETIGRADYIFEILMMGLRTSRGVFLPRLEKLGGIGTTEGILSVLNRYGKIYREKADRLILTERGIEILNPILLSLLEWKEDFHSTPSST